MTGRRVFRWLTVPTLALALAIVLAPSAGVPAARADDPTPSACRATAEVTVWPKLVCPLEPVVVSLHVKTQCPAVDGQPVHVTSVRVPNPLPDSLLPMPDPDPPSGGADARAPAWTFETLPTQGVTVTHRVRPRRPGRHVIGAGIQLELEDSLGRVATAPLRPTELQVAARCAPPRGTAIYLPHVVRPRCRHSSQPADIVLLVDRSSSLGPKALAATLQRLRFFLDEVDLARDRVALVAFDTTSEVLAPLGSSREAIEAALGAVQPAPGTRIEIGLAHATAELAARGRPDVRRVIALISDGVETPPGTPQDVHRAADDARRAGIAVLTLALGPYPDRTLMQTVAGTPARTLSAPAHADLEAAYRALAELASCA